MSDTSDSTGDAEPGPLTLVVRAAFVAEGEAPPADLATVMHPLRFRATFEPATGVLSVENARPGLHGEVRAEWKPSPPDGQETNGAIAEE